MRQVFLYGIAGADQNYRVVRYEQLVDDDITIRNITYEASMMRIRYPNVKAVYAVDNRRGLNLDYFGAMKKNSIESWTIFKDIVEREGLRIV